MLLFTQKFDRNGGEIHDEMSNDSVFPLLFDDILAYGLNEFPSVHVVWVNEFAGNLVPFHVLQHGFVALRIQVIRVDDTFPLSRRKRERSNTSEDIAYGYDIPSTQRPYK